jgi:hypothetical protein
MRPKVADPLERAQTDGPVSSVLKPPLRRAGLGVTVSTHEGSHLTAQLQVGPLASTRLRRPLADRPLHGDSAPQTSVWEHTGSGVLVHAECPDLKAVADDRQ